MSILAWERDLPNHRPNDPVVSLKESGDPTRDNGGPHGPLPPSMTEHPGSEGRIGAVRPRNYILSQMPAEPYANIARFLVPVELPLHMQLSQPNQAIEHLYFPTSGLISTDAITESGESVEVGVTGREGFSGVNGLLGHPQMAHTVVMQGGGFGYRIRLSVFREEFLKGGALQQLVYSFLYMSMTQMTQSILCNRMHPVDARLARWLLTSADRMEEETLQLTQEFLSQMLGSRRSTVTVAAGGLQAAGLIDYSRGKIKITDRPGLEQCACECYGMVRAVYERLLPAEY